jgi:hypothetical protein
MPLLQVRDIPQDLYEKLAQVAESENRSIAQETIVLLRKALNLTEERISRRKKVLDLIRKNKTEGTNDFPDPVTLLREDRER